MKLINQSNPTLRIETGKDLTDATLPKIRYQTPTGGVGVFEATIEGTKLRKKFTTEELEPPGTWLFQPEVTNFGDILIGQDKVRVTVERPIANP